MAIRKASIDHSDPNYVQGSFKTHLVKSRAGKVRNPKSNTRNSFDGITLAHKKARFYEEI